MSGYKKNRNKRRSYKTDDSNTKSNNEENYNRRQSLSVKVVSTSVNEEEKNKKDNSKKSSDNKNSQQQGNRSRKNRNRNRFSRNENSEGNNLYSKDSNVVENKKYNDDERYTKQEKYTKQNDNKKPLENGNRNLRSNRNKRKSYNKRRDRNQQEDRFSIKHMSKSERFAIYKKVLEKESITNKPKAVPRMLDRKIHIPYKIDIEKQIMCPICKKVITSAQTALKDKHTGSLSHFDCIYNNEKEKAGLRDGQRFAYIGKGFFAVLETEVIDGKKVSKIDRRIEYLPPDIEK